MVQPLRVFRAEAKSILSKTTGFIAEAGFTHSLTPARNCTYGCTYCYVPTLGIYGGLKPDDWKRWGQFTTYKSNAAGLLSKQLRPDQRIYCSPLVDPYQPAEAEECAMPALIRALIESPPAIFTIQTRGPLVLRDLPLLSQLSRRTKLRVSFSLTTNRDDVRRAFEPHCAPLEDRLRTMAELQCAGITTYATLAPILPCDPEEFATIALSATDRDLIGDPLHVRATKSSGATTRDAAFAICKARGTTEWLDPKFQSEVVARIRRVAERAGRRFATGPEGFSWLAQN